MSNGPEDTSLGSTAGSGTWETAPGSGRLVIDASYFPLAFFLSFCTLTLSVSSRSQKIGWGRTEITVPAGRHHVRVHVNYLGKLGPAETSVDVPAGAGTEIYYRAPAFMFMRGATGTTRPASPGRVGLVAMAAVLALFVLVPVLFSAWAVRAVDSPRPAAADRLPVAGSPTSSAERSAPDVALAPFTGIWERTDGSFTINPEGSAIRIRRLAEGACGVPGSCTANGQMILRSGQDGESLIGTFTDVWYTSEEQVLSDVPGELQRNQFAVDDTVYVSLGQHGYLSTRPLGRLIDTVDLTDRSGTGPPDGIVDSAWIYCNDETATDWTYLCQVPSPSPE